MERNPSFDQIQERQHAETVDCAYCHRPAGKTCIARDSSGATHPLRNFPAHPDRMRDARVVHAADCEACGSRRGTMCVDRHGQLTTTHKPRVIAAAGGNR